MLAIGITSITLAQDGRDTAALRRDSAASVLVGDSAIAEILTALSSRKNSLLLGKNYDPLNPRTGKNYLGEDGIPNSGDETNNAINEWSQQSTYACQSVLNVDNPDIVLNNQLSPISSYQILAYRYNPNFEEGHLLVEGIHQGISHYIHISVSITPDLSIFPGVLATESMYWQGRDMTGINNMVYFSPSLSANNFLKATASTNDKAREDYLDAVWSGPTDGFLTDPMMQTLVACDLTFSLPNKATGKDLGVISSDQSLSGEIDSIVEFQADNLELAGSSEIIVDTTNGPVHLYINGTLSLKDQAKIRNIRSDGQPPQAGDFRLIQTQSESAPVVLHDTTCIENAFIYAPEVDFHLLTTGDGCPGDSNSNVIGVVWAQDIENSTNSLVPSLYSRGSSPDMPSIGMTSGIEVPENLSSLMDALQSMNLPVLYQMQGVTSWESVGL